MNDFPKKDIILVIGEAPGIKNTIASALSAENFQIKQINWAKGNTHHTHQTEPHITAKPTEKTEALIQKICSNGDRVGAIISFVGFDNKNSKRDDLDTESIGFFNILKAFEKDLRSSSADGGGKIFTITPFGGGFGLSYSHVLFPEAAGPIGITKSAGLEWPEITVRCIDVDLKMDVDRIAAQLIQEMFKDETAREIGLTAKGRCTLVLEEQPVVIQKNVLTPESVLLVLGGGSGITAAITKEIARQHQPKIILVGRSPVVQQESNETVHLKDVKALKSHFIRYANKTDNAFTPKEINQKINNILKQRQLNANIKAMMDAGAQIEYFAMDVRNAGILTHLIQEMYNRFGRIDGVVHGAGVIDDHLIHDKSLSSFKMVYDTKVVPAQVLMKHLNPDSLKFLVFFSSIAARFGNIGQSDYSAANEVLNKYAHSMAKRWPESRVVSIGWGPWETGMVSDDLKNFYQKNGVGLIPADQGIAFFLNEIGLDAGAPAEIVATADLNLIAAKGLGRRI